MPITEGERTEAIWFARFSSVERSSPGGFWDLGIGATVGGCDEFVRGRFLGVIVGVWILKCFDDGGVVNVEVDFIYG